MRSIRILFFADTHLGFDLPQRPRVIRRRRGYDFFANFERVLQVAADRKVDFVVHGGDLFFRSRIPPALVQRAFLPLKRVADGGMSIFLVPGNHERSRIPYEMLALHPRIHIFDRPRTFIGQVEGVNVAFTGFPYYRHEVRRDFPVLLDQTGWHAVEASCRLLCVHQCFEGATVGPVDYMFRNGPDVVRLADVPTDFAAVLSGHVHRHQVLTCDLRGNMLETPVLYPGSIERTSFAERDEAKGYLVLEVDGRNLRSWDFRELPARPMLAHDVRANGRSATDFELAIQHLVERAPRDAVMRIRFHGPLDAEQRKVVTAAKLRQLVPSTMNLETVFVDEKP